MRFIPLLFLILINCEFAFAQSNAKSLLKKGDVFYENLQYKEAIKEYSKSYEKQSSAEALEGLGKAYFELGTQHQFNGKATEANSHYATGLEYAEQLVNRDETSSEGRLLRGIIYIYLAEPDKAKLDFQYVNTNYPDNGRAYYYLWTLDPSQGLVKIEHPYVYQALDLDSTLFELHQELGAYYSGLNMGSEAIASFEKALEISPKNYKANFSLGQVYWAMGDLEKMRYYFGESLKYYPDFGYAEMMLAGVELMSGNFSESIPLIRSAIKHNPATEQYLGMYIENYPDLANYNFKDNQQMDGPLDAQGYPSHYQEAVGLAQSFDYFSAIDKFHQSYDVYEPYEQAQVAWKVSIMAWLAHCYRESGDYAQASKFGKKALDMAILEGLPVDQASLAANLAIVYDSWGDNLLAIQYQKMSVDMINRYKQDEKRYDAFTNMGVYFRKWGEFDSAIYYHELALQEVDVSEVVKLALIKKELAISYSANKNHKKAKQLVNDLQTLRKSMTDQSQDAAFDFGIAKVYYESGDYQMAREFIEAAAPFYLDLQEVAPAHPLMFPFVETYIGISTMTDDIPLAYNNFLAMNDILFILTNQFFPSMNENGKLNYYREVKNRYESFNSFVINQTNKPAQVFEKMFENQLLMKGLLFNTAQKMQLQMANSMNPELKKQYGELVKRKNIIARSITLSQEENQLRGLNAGTIQKEIDSLEVVLSQSGMDMQIQRLYEDGLVQKVRTHLGPTEAAVEIVRFRNYDFSQGGHFTNDVNYMALILRGDREAVDYVLLQNGNEMESKAYQSYVKSIEYDLEDVSSYGYFWGSIQEKLTGIDKVYLAGDGVYHKININTLYNPKTDQYVIDGLDIRLLTSTRDILKETIDLPKRGNIFLMGFPSFELQTVNTNKVTIDSVRSVGSRAFTSIEFLAPLPGTFLEVKTIEEIFSSTKWTTEVLTGAEALEENIKNVDSPTVLHIATHGYFEESMPKDNPLLYSGLLLAGASSNYTQKIIEGEDGILTAYEAMHLNLSNTQMVVLSACETGMGRIENGDGVYGLQRAFLIAGAQSVVMSMWKVNDQTTMELMSDFYSKLTVSKDKHLAFRAAQLELKLKHPNPKYWGAFNIVGK